MPFFWTIQDLSLFPIYYLYCENFLDPVLKDTLECMVLVQMEEDQVNYLYAFFMVRISFNRKNKPLFNALNYAVRYHAKRLIHLFKLPPA